MTIRLTAAVSALALAAAAAAPAAAQEITVMSWGGAYTKSQVEAYYKPFTAETGINVVSVDADNPATPIKAQVEAGNVTVDVADVEFADAVRLCDEGLLEPIDHSILAPGADGSAPEDDFVPDSLVDCFVPTIVYTIAVAYDTTKFPEKPTSVADFFDLEKFPGKRSMRRNAKSNLEMALMADGVPAAEVYDVLGTPEGVDRAFAKLDTIKADTIWWEAGAQAPQLLADGEVTMAAAFNGRIFSAAITEGKPFEILWDGQVYETEGYVIPKGAPNVEDALKFIAFASQPQQLADQASWISYGPARKSSGDLVGMYQDGKTDMKPHMPTAAENLTNALPSSYEFWVDHDSELNERFNAWLAS
jgi:putative spermidine/putrescine transport system substrate-binding protein